MASTPRIFRQSQAKVVERLYNLTVLHFNRQKRKFSLLLNIPCPPYSMSEYNKTITRTNINVLINIGPGAGGGRKRRGKEGNLPNTFDDDCRTRRVVGSNPIWGSDFFCVLLWLILYISLYFLYNSNISGIDYYYCYYYYYYYYCCCC